MSVPEAIPVELSYELTDLYGGHAVAKTDNSFELPEIDPKLKLFDGYIHTPEGDFAFQGPIAKAKSALKDIE